MSEEQRSNGFSLFLAGLGVGALVGVLFAPKAGRETRDELLSGAREGTEYLRQRSRDAASQVNEYVDRGKDYADKGRAQWEDFVNRGRSFVNEKTEKVSAAVDAGKEAYRQTAAGVSSAVESGKDAYRDTADRVNAAVDAGKQAYRETATGTTGGDSSSHS